MIHNEFEPLNGQLANVLVSVAMQLWLDPTPPQSTVSVEVAAFHIPV